MSDISKYLVLNEERNAFDYLKHANLFLSQVEKDIFSLKWFIIAFHSALYSYMLLALQKVDAEQIYQKQKTNNNQKKKTPMEEFESKRILKFLTAYELLKNEKNMANAPYMPNNMQDICMTTLNDELRNQIIHFKPMVLGYEAWYPARVTLPLLDVLEFCIKKTATAAYQKYGVYRILRKIKKLLIKHAVIYSTREYLPEQLSDVNNTMALVKKLLNHFDIPINNLLIYFARTDQPTREEYKKTRAFAFFAEDKEIFSYPGLHISEAAIDVNEEIKYIIVIYDKLNQEKNQIKKAVILSHELAHISQFVQNENYSRKNSLLGSYLGKPCQDLPNGIDADIAAISVVKKLFNRTQVSNFIQSTWNNTRISNATIRNYDWLKETDLLWRQRKTAIETFCKTTNDSIPKRNCKKLKLIP